VGDSHDWRWLPGTGGGFAQLTEAAGKRRGRGQLLLSPMSADRTAMGDARDGGDVGESVDSHD